MKENVKYTDIYKKEVKCLVRTDIIPWENCGVIGTIPYKEGITDVNGIVLKVGDYVKVVDIRNERSQIVTSIIIDNGNRLVPYCNKDYDGNKDILLIKVGEFPTYSHMIDPEKEEPRFVTMDQSEFDKQALTYYKAQYENTLSKLEVLQKKYDNSYRTQISLENTNELLKHKIEKMEARMNTMYEKSCMDKKPSTDELSDKELTKAFINRLFGVKNIKNGIKDDSIIHCKSKEETEWFFNIVNDATSMKYFEIYDSSMSISYLRPYILSLFDTAPCIKNSGLYFKYTYRPLKVVLVDIDEKDRPEDILEASDLMKQKEIKDED